MDIGPCIPRTVERTLDKPRPLRGYLSNFNFSPNVSSSESLRKTGREAPLTESRNTTFTVTSVNELIYLHNSKKQEDLTSLFTR